MIDNFGPQKQPSSINKIQAENKFVMNELKDIQIDEAVDFLNELVQLDRKTIQNLIEYRISCNKEIMNSDLVTIGFFNNKFKLGILGILNGLLADGKAVITAVYDENGNLKEFMRQK